MGEGDLVGESYTREDIQLFLWEGVGIVDEVVVVVMLLE